MPRFVTNPVVALSLRGWGQTEAPTSESTVEEPALERASLKVIQRYARDVVALMDALNMPGAVLVGDSFGALVAMQVAATNKQRVDKIVSSEWTKNPRCPETFRSIEPLF